MLTLQDCRKVISAKDFLISDAELVKIRELFYFWAAIEFSNYLKSIQK